MKKAIKRVTVELSRIEHGLYDEDIEPNVGNNSDHVIQIICGAGLLGGGRNGKLKDHTLNYLRNRSPKLPFWHDYDNGIFFVRFTL